MCFDIEHYSWLSQGCGNTMPDLSDLVPFHSGQVRIFGLLVLGQVKIDLQFCISVIYYELTHVENNVDPDQLASGEVS